jgi:hypothetical protein
MKNSKAKVEKKLTGIEESREIERLGQELDFELLTDRELTELLGIKNMQFGESPPNKRTLEILRAAKERQDKRNAETRV